MKPNLKQDLPLLPFILLPVAYLIYIWGDLPQQVPIHWNINGEIDNYGDKSILVGLAIGLPLVSYLLFIFIPLIDPKKRVAQMGKKLQRIKYVMTLFMVGIALFVIHASANQSSHNFNFLILGLGLLFVFMGSYFKTIKPNYFLGLRTPWTLESETVWKTTHILAGKMWFIGGLVIVLFSLVVPQKYSLIIFLVITGIITIIPVVYSYVLFKREKMTEKGEQKSMGGKDFALTTVYFRELKILCWDESQLSPFLSKALLFLLKGGKDFVLIMIYSKEMKILCQEVMLNCHPPGLPSREEKILL